MSLRKRGSQTRDIELHIEELVLQGFAPGDRLAIRDAVERELGRLIGQNAMPGLDVSRRQSVAIERLDAGTFHVQANARPQAIGGQVAKAVFEGLNAKPAGQPAKGTRQG
jgi:hypothetical protein